MSVMLGEMLVKVGALTQTQLDQVLNAQAIYGGRLGTNLVEMGFLAEEDLSRVLKEKLGVPCVDTATVNSLTPDILAAVPVDLIQRYHVLPIAVSGKKLTLAMADPADFQAIDEIGFVTGFVIVPRVCTELRLNMALERYYGIRREVRYIPVAGGFSSRFADAIAGGKPGTSASPAETQGAEPPPESEGKRISVNALADLLAAAGNEISVVSAIIDYLAGEFDRGAFLTLKAGVVVGVQAVCAGAAVEGFGRLTIPLDEAQLLSRVVSDRRLFIGELGPEGADGRLLQAMGGESRSPALLLPLAIDGHVGGLICANDLKGRLAGGIFDLQRVAAMAELTFEMLCLRKRIRNC